ncbi:TnsA-like heteromeric transposase endonuclease subunit [Kitasatospora cystarginea]|uniref:TnsA-like heteromeric transposase endonuclease subunit n=1 Tax=Kitasatospora cystarginea TaxID=58350 RepID=UPI0031D17F0C
MLDHDLVATAAVRAKYPDGAELVNGGFTEAPIERLLAAGPWRTFRWYLGQKHYSGSYWSATERAHVIYESRLELARLLYADFDPGVSRIIAQPFLVTVQVDGAVRRHIPDFLLLADAGPVVVDVKPADRLSRPEVAFTFGWCRTVVEARGWRYQVWSEPPAAEVDNIRFLAGYRRDWLFNAGLLEDLCRADLDGVTLESAFGAVANWDPGLVRAAVFHLLWSGRLVTELDRPLSGDHVVRCAR